MYLAFVGWGNAFHIFSRNHDLHVLLPRVCHDTFSDSDCFSLDVFVCIDLLGLVRFVYGFCRWTWRWTPCLSCLSHQCLLVHTKLSLKFFWSLHVPNPVLRWHGSGKLGRRSVPFRVITCFTYFIPELFKDWTDSRLFQLHRTDGEGDAVWTMTYVNIRVSVWSMIAIAIKAPTRSLLHKSQKH